MIKRILTFCWLLIVGSWLLAKPAFGKDFSSFYKTTYEFDQTGKAYVTQEVSLINEQPDLYVSEYSLSISGQELRDVDAYDSVGPLKSEIKKKDTTTIVTLYFNDKVVGKGKILSFIIKYKSEKLAEKKGNLWEISIPKLGNSSQIDDYQTTLKVPLSFGKAAYISPLPVKEEQNEKFRLLSFNKESLVSYGVIATFGQYQTFEFSLYYDLENTSNGVLKENVAFPPDTASQEVYYENIYPEPINVKIDGDGNWLGEYEIPKNKVLHIEAKGKVKIFSSPKRNFYSPKDFSNYLSPSKYWQTDDPKLKKLAEKLKTPENIYEYVVKTLSYNEELIKNKDITRKGALYSINNPQNSLCTEFADLFVTLCRAAGIPARELEGYADTEVEKNNKISQNDDLLHSWVEYYDGEKQQWLMADPTFGKTTGGLDFYKKFDMSHFVFVIHGNSDSFPFPAGSYRTSETSGKQIFVSFGQVQIPTTEYNLELKSFSPRNLLTLKDNHVENVLVNRSGFALYNQKIIVEAKNSLPPKEFFVEILPPYGQKIIKFDLKPKELFKDYFGEISITPGNKITYYKHKVQSVMLRIIFISAIILSVLLIFILVSIRKTSRNKKLKK